MADIVIQIRPSPVRGSSLVFRWLVGRSFGDPQAGPGFAIGGLSGLLHEALSI
jgi:hypothetical protein